MQVRLGNDGAAEGAVTEVVFPDDWSIGQAFMAVVDPRGVWAAHSVDSTPPTWVASDNESLQGLLADHFKCPAGGA